MRYFKDAKGRDIVLVPLGKSGRVATLLKNDYERMIAMGAYPTWQIVQGRYPKTHSRKDRSTILISRLLTNCPPGYTVTYFDGNSLNLVRDNLGLRPNRRNYNYRDYSQHMLPELKTITPLTDIVGDGDHNVEFGDKRK